MSPIPGQKTSIARTALRVTTRTMVFTARFLFLALFAGPKQLLTARISAKCAAVIMAMCLPSLLCYAILMLPEFIFREPYQNTYYEFAQVLANDQGRWVAFALSCLCVFISLAMPATMPAPRRPVVC